MKVSATHLTAILAVVRVCMYVCVHDLITGIPATEVCLRPVLTISGLLIILYDCHGSGVSKVCLLYIKS